MVFTATTGAMREGSPGLGALLARIPFVWRLISLAAVCLLWEYGERINFNWAFPSFLETMTAMWEMVSDGSLGAAYLRTLEPLAIGLVLSLAVGIGAGVAMGLRTEAEWFVLPIFITAQAAPMAALIPLVTFVYGIGLASKVMAVMILATPVIAINSYKAVRNVSPSLTAMSRSFMGSRWQTITKVVLPAASPMMFAGLRLGVAEGFSGVVLAELLITPTGIGDLITYHRSIANFGHMYAVILSILVFAVVTVGLLHRVETALFRPEKRSAR
jgi:NitT/TauT family transport system permease protein